jgi:DNA (cytosine-5)-methyltransferase 1
MSRPVAVDLFAGAGGMTLGFEQAGFDVVCAIEFDPAHAAAHRFNFPLCQVVEADARTLTASQLKEAVASGLRKHGREPDERVDVVFGGPPCQGFSVGGLRDPEDPRNRLVEEYARLVAALDPAAWVLENVPAMAKRSLPGSDSKLVIDWMGDHLKKDGYEIAASGVLNTGCFGVPQDRRRLIAVGTRDEVAVQLPAATTAGRPRIPGAAPRTGELGHAGTPTGLPGCPTAADALGDLPDLDGYSELWTSDVVTMTEADREAMQDHASPYARRLRGETADPADLSWPRRRSPSRLSASMRTSHGVDVIKRFASTPPGERESVSRFIRLHPDGVSPTLRAGTAPDRGSYSAPRPIHYEHDRVISVREAARLHGFPDWFRPTAAKWHGFRQVGNAVPPPLACAVAAQVLTAFEWSRQQPESEERMKLGDPDLLRVANGGGRSAAKRLLEASTEVADAA